MILKLRVNVADKRPALPAYPVIQQEVLTELTDGSDHEASGRAARGFLFRQGYGWLCWKEKRSVLRGCRQENKAFVINAQKTKRLRTRVLK